MAERRVRWTEKARRELLLFLPELSYRDAEEFISGLEREDFHRKLRSEGPGDVLWVFTPEVHGEELGVKLVLRNDCVVVSFHRDDDEGDDHDEEG